MSTKDSKKIIKLLALIIAIWLSYQTICYGYWWLMAWSVGPDRHEEMIDKIRQFPSEMVIKKLYSSQLSSPYPFMALRVLVERREKKAAPILIKRLKSWNRGVRRDAIWALGVINDTRAIEPLMEIVKHGEKDPNYSDALMALSRMKCEEAFPYVVKLAKDKNAVGNGSIAMLREFGKPECISLLIDIKNRIGDADPLSKFDRSQIDSAIKHIESSQVKK